jgi:site-specific DNA-methyltransferase (adenine-specific)
MLQLNNLYNMDCMDGMKEFPDGYFELAIVDPPYGVGSLTYTPCKRRKVPCGYIDTYKVVVATLDMNQRSSVKSKYIPDIEYREHGKPRQGNFGDDNVAPPPKYFEELFRVSKNQIIWGGNHFLLPPSRGFVVWCKDNVPENFCLSMAEYAWTSFPRISKVVKCVATSKPGERFHPTQKPVKVYDFLLKHFANPGDKILDTHAGSASSLVACKRAGYEYIGFEIDEWYYNLAQKRLEEASAQTTLFGGEAGPAAPPGPHKK